MEEQWKPIIITKNGVLYDFTGFYEISNYGRVKSLDRVDCTGHKHKEKMLKLKVNNKGYLFVSLSKNGKKEVFFIHRLVATMFIPNPQEFDVVNHLDENPLNCMVDNLEWCTQKYNVQYSAYRKKGKQFSEEHKKHLREAHKGIQAGSKNPRARKVICLETNEIFGCIKEAEQWCGKQGVKQCCRKERKTCGGYHWMYLEDYRRDLRMKSDFNNSKLLVA